MAGLRKRGALTRIDLSFDLRDLRLQGLLAILCSGVTGE
jgi:hypothetical protein